MKRHTWTDDTCTRCGLKRERRMQQKWQRTYTVVRHGVCEDRHVFTENLRYHYGERYGFDRPDCT